MSGVDDERREEDTTRGPWGRKGSGEVTGMLGGLSVLGSSPLSVSLLTFLGSVRTRRWRGERGRKGAEEETRPTEPEDFTDNFITKNYWLNCQGTNHPRSILSFMDISIPAVCLLSDLISFTYLIPSVVSSRTERNRRWRDVRVRDTKGKRRDDKRWGG